MKSQQKFLIPKSQSEEEDIVVQEKPSFLLGRLKFFLGNFNPLCSYLEMTFELKWNFLAPLFKLYFNKGKKMFNICWFAFLTQSPSVLIDVLVMEIKLQKITKSFIFQKIS